DVRRKTLAVMSGVARAIAGADHETEALGDGVGELGDAAREAAGLKARHGLVGLLEHRHQVAVADEDAFLGLDVRDRHAVQGEYMAIADALPWHHRRKRSPGLAVLALPTATPAALPGERPPHRRE